ncbi:hypothetical protein [Sulfitobacter donghicola]|uniref:Uncharacterized protein n=1 Tax=Sulfitobacter donghicola DSW-25 = KCTC 12864 = JCM 14565 TaxID=1300350 RepID=A0A073IRT3_9RHOB|nr:hypothetical protein [Sulfitobacter donghicola]KEJ88097.1 hypothetical protein DSW25_17670 [Sulfitobacter donghicola DSW-25 = KCTC 12864 = JCM 14565]KIN68682.1 hypothetical protein Z948_2413 [Sulfitobacter donghicola DSW-25 = KCTC 12864 = JCM 14565]
MTALTKYDRLEATGLWRPDPEGQRREVIVSIGNATLMVADMNDQAITHWSLAAVERANAGQLPAIFHPDGDTGETLELSENESEMIEAIEQLQKAIAKKRPRPGRLRWLSATLSVGTVLAVMLFWLPGAMRDNTLRVVPQVKRESLGVSLIDRMQRVTGPMCNDSDGLRALRRLGARLETPKLAVVPGLGRPALHLPGGVIVLDRSVFEDWEEPDVAAGFILSELALQVEQDPLGQLLDVVGPWENFRLLTTGEISETALDGYAEYLMTAKTRRPDTANLLALFEASDVRSTPYAKAYDITGETVLDLIEGDPMQGRETDPLLPDSTWLRLQGLCGG